MNERSLHDGRDDKLVPLESLDLANVDSFADLLEAMSKTAFGGRQLGEAFDIFQEMARSESCRIVLTVSGAMTVAQQGTILCDLIDRGVVQAIVATGALVAHGLTESMGLTHYRYDPASDDKALFDQGYNRIYDTLEMEANLNEIERLVHSVLETIEPPDGVWSAARLCRSLGARLAGLPRARGILRSAYEQGVPVFIPAFTDCELGLDVATWSLKRALDSQDATALSAEDVYSKTAPTFNPFVDLLEYARFVGDAGDLGILTIGGGVPRNWAQQVAPFYDITNARLGTRLPAPRFKYGIRICPEPAHWGGLSGCTYSEGVSWGKFVPASEGGRFAEVHADATVVLPLLAKGLLEKLG